MNPTRLVPIAALAFVLVSQGAAGHAMLDHAEPAVGRASGPAPAEIRLWFNGRLEPGLCAIELAGSDGTKTELETARVDGKDANEVRVKVPKLPPGAYRVYWRVISVDTHMTQGDFTFRVGP